VRPPDTYLFSLSPLLSPLLFFPLAPLGGVGESQSQSKSESESKKPVPLRGEFA
jgi:hypothetical protein